MLNLQTFPIDLQRYDPKEIIEQFPLGRLCDTLKRCICICVLQLIYVISQV